MLKCKNCGAEIQDGSSVCGYCGDHIAEPPTSDTTSQAPMQPSGVRGEAKARVFVPLKKVALLSPKGDIKTAPVGFSFTILLFGLFVCLFRKDWLRVAVWFAMIFLGGFISIFEPVFEGLFMVITFVFNVVMAFIYNKVYIRSLLRKGYEPMREEDKLTLAHKEIILLR